MTSLFYRTRFLGFTLCNHNIFCLWCLGVLCASVIVWPGQAAAAVDFNISGVEEDVANNIRLHIGSLRELPGTDAASIREEINNDVVKALQAMGYYQFEIQYGLDDEDVNIAISLGEPIVWGEANIQILQNSEPPAELLNIKNQHPFNPGERLSHKAYENYKRQLINVANEFGYLDAQMQKSELRINPELGKAHVNLTLSLKERYRVGDINLSNTEISSQLTDQIIDIKKGDWFNADSVGVVYNSLLNSGYFAAVNIIVDRQPPSTANLNVEMTDSPEHRVETGIGYGTDTGPRFKVSWERAHINSRGNSQQNELLVSQVEQSLASRYRIPWPHPQNRYLSWDTGYQRKVVENTETQEATTGFNFHLLGNLGWQYSAGIDLKSERSEVNNVPEPDVNYLIPSVSISKRSVWGTPSDPNYAYKVSMGLAYGNDLGSDTDFFKLTLGLNTLVSFAEKHSLISRLEWGGINFNASDFIRVPRTQRFFVGGDQTVRGYDFETISPLDEDGELIGGQYYSAASLEYRYRFAPNWQAALFADGGRSYLKDDAFCALCVDTGKEYKTSTGLGVRWLSPVGFIAADVAFPLNEIGDNDEPGKPSFHIYLGTQL